MSHNAGDALCVDDVAVVFIEGELSEDVAREQCFCEAFLAGSCFFNLTDAGAKYIDGFDFRQKGCGNMLTFWLSA